MSVSDELDRLHRLHQDGVLTDEELDRGRAAVLVPPPANATPDHLDEIRRQQEAAQFDREWEAERKRYLVRRRDGVMYIPTRTESIVCGVLCLAFGIGWVAASVGTAAPSYFPLIGIAAGLVGVGMSAHLYVRASRYREARRRYQEHRRAILNRGDTAGPPR